MDNYYALEEASREKLERLIQEAEKARLNVQPRQRTIIKRQFRRVMTATGTVLIVAGQRIQVG